MTAHLLELARARGLDPEGPLRFSVLLVDVAEDRAEVLFGALEAAAFTIEAVLADPDAAHLLFVQASETRRHDEASLTARASELALVAHAHHARIADWSVARPR